MAQQVDPSIKRLFYLANELRSPLPAGLVKYVPQGEILQGLASFGLTGAEVGKSLSRPQLQQLIKTGSGDGKATHDEWKYLIGALVTESLTDQKDTLELHDFMKKMDMLSRWMNGGSSIIATEEGSFADEGEAIEKWKTGFSPFDSVFQGFYQGLFVVMGSTGTGKTSHMLALAEMIRKSNLADEIWFYQTEIPSAMFKYRMTPIRNRTKFLPEKDRIFYGQQSITEIIELVKSNPNPRRVIFHDSPDVIAASNADDGRRFELENLYRDLVILKSWCQAIFVASQVRRKDRIIKTSSVSESWAKAWYADGMIGIQKMGQRQNTSLMKAVVVKNRFGPADIEITYNFDMVNLVGGLDSKSKPRASGWVDEEEDAEEDW